jgi:hypothetical protein
MAFASSCSVVVTGDETMVVAPNFPCAVAVLEMLPAKISEPVTEWVPLQVVAPPMSRVVDEHEIPEAFVSPTAMKSSVTFPVLVTVYV